MTLKIIRVSIFTPLRTVFDYLPPLETAILPVPGLRVLVPFGQQEKIGLIVEVTDSSEYPLEKLKNILKILDTIPLFSKTLLALIQWASHYYQEPLGKVIEAALPSVLRKTSTKPFSPIKIPTPTSVITSPPPYKLNAAQQKAITAVQQSIKTFKTFLLEGVTGSGKTEVYMRLIEEVLSHSKQVLILVPEIGLTPVLLARFEARFNVPIALLHSGLTPKKRHQAWEMARNGQAKIIIGTRSAAFTPLSLPGLFIIDEEHDPSFKQQDRFRYHARDLIIKRGSLENCPVVLGTATPALETLHNTIYKRFQKLTLPYRTGTATLPTVQILDIRHKKLEEGLSMQLLKAMQEHLNEKGQILLFLNRRGFAPILMCYGCGWVAHCKHCDSKMTFYAKSNKLKCHHCQWTIALITECPSCQNCALNPIGFGTERLEATLQKHFPTKKIIRLDRDTTHKKDSIKIAMQQIYDEEANILLGTQMIAKGHHFPNVTLVGILNIDQGLFSIDYRSLERMGQLITQVSGRTGRALRSGHVILQTAHPEHPLLKMLLEEGYSAFSNTLLVERQAASLPPYSYQVLFRAESKKIERPTGFLNFVKLLAKESDLPNLKILGPTPAPMEKRVGKFHAQLLLQTNLRSKLQKTVTDLIMKIESHPLSRSVHWSVDVDPIEMF